MDPMVLTAVSLQNDLQKMNVIANNAANALTPGFKRELAAVSAAFSEQALMRGDTLPAVSPLPLRVVSDQTPGVARQTGNPLDLTMLGTGYFEVQIGDGLAYTRQGSFRLDAQGRLVTEAGHAVSGMSGDIILNSSNVRIDRQGRVMDGDKQVAQIKVVSFEQQTPALSSIGGGLLAAASGQRPQVMERPQIAQGQLESSNVDSTKEMIRLVETYRHFESASKVLQAYDDLKDKTFRSLGQF